MVPVYLQNLWLTYLCPCRSHFLAMLMFVITDSNICSGNSFNCNKCKLSSSRHNNSNSREVPRGLQDPTVRWVACLLRRRLRDSKLHQARNGPYKQ